MGPIKRTISMFGLGLAGAWAVGALKNFLQSSVAHEIQNRAVENATSFYAQVAVPTYSWFNDAFQGSGLEKITDNIGAGLTIVGAAYLANKAVDYGKRQIKNTQKY